MEDNLFRMYDTNMDGVISMEEFLIFYHICSEGTPEQNLMKENPKSQSNSKSFSQTRIGSFLFQVQVQVILINTDVAWT